MPLPGPRLAACVVLALLAFAANSLFCRLALGRDTIDAATFTLLRFGSGAVALVALNLLRRPRVAGLARGHAASVAALALYAVPFSLAYRQLSAGTGALLLFGAVQVTILAVALARGERPRRGEWLGFALALAGLVYLVSPGLAAPAPAGSALMIAAGIAWGVYTLRGRRAGDPLATTAANFVWTVPLVAAFWLAARLPAVVTPIGATGAILCGARASGLGYTALPSLTATRAAIVQLTVPVLAAFGGVLFLAETITWRLTLAAALVLGGVALAIFARATSNISPAAETPSPRSPDR